VCQSPRSSISAAMKFARATLCCLGLAAVPWHTAAEQQGDRTITQVVKLLQDLAEKSKQEGDVERDLYAKYKCYCDTTEAEKKTEISQLSEEIALLESEIDALQASSGKLSKEVAQLKADITANKEAQDEATSIRKQENDEFIALEADLKQAIGQMSEAITTLSEVGADQTMAEGADHKQYMAGYEGGAGLMKLRSTVKAALLAANAFVGKKQAKVVDAFLQAPFTGTYTAQSGEVVGILKDMLDTFTKNLDAATAKEAAALEAYNKYMGELEKAAKEMQESYDKKQGKLGSNDGGLSSKREQLDTARVSLAEAQDFLAKLQDMCAAKKKQYDERVALRANEQAALSEAIAVLNSDAAFATFGTVDATKTGATSFVQATRRASVRRHVGSMFAVSESAPSFQAQPPKSPQEFLQKAAKAQGSSILGRIASLLQAHNPFSTVLKEIEKMIGLIGEEGVKDAKQHEWCLSERTTTQDGITSKTNEITDLGGDIQTLTDEIENPETGLKAMIQLDEEALQQNYNSQETQTKERRDENLAYQKDISNLVEAEALLDRAIVILRKYYSKISAELKGAMLVQAKKAKRDEPAPPATWEDKYQGQSSGGTDAISMLEFIRKNTKSEETMAHTDENAAQHSYEDSMADLKTEEADTQKALASNRKLLAEKEETLLQKKAELERAQKERKALEDYLSEIKPGCDFIVENLELRDTNRANEKQALEQAVDLIKGTPAYQEAMAEAHTESLGDCKDICAKGEAHVDCKACLAGVTVPGYCAGHPSTEGCA